MDEVCNHYTDLRRLCVQYRLQAAWRFGLSDLIEAGEDNYYPAKGVAPIFNLPLLKVTQVRDWCIRQLSST